MDETVVAAVQAQFAKFADGSHGARVVVSGSGQWLRCTDPVGGVIVAGIFNPLAGWHLSGRELTPAGEPGGLLFSVAHDLADKVENFGPDDDDDPHGTFYLWVMFSDALKDTGRQLRMRPLTRAIPGLTLDTAGGACPFQAEGTLHGLPFYFRYRSAHATLSLCAPDAEEFDYFAPLYLAGMDFGEEYDGFLSDEQFQGLFADLVRQLVRAPRLWEFTGAQVGDLAGCPTGTPRTYGAWGHTPQEAYATLTAKPGMWVESLGEWDDHVTAMALDPATITVDDRVWPDPEPAFTVNMQPADHPA
ncbi:hypothetical protein [Tessaracoccus sp.]